MDIGIKTIPILLLFFVKTSGLVWVDSRTKGN